MCAAVDEQNDQTLTFEAENTCHLPVDDDDYHPIISPVGDGLMISRGSGGLSLTPAVSPAHMPSSSSGYGSSTHGGLLSPDELPAQDTAESSLGNVLTLHHGPDISAEPGGISSQPGDIPNESVGLSSCLSITLTQPADALTKPVPGCSSTSHVRGISSEVGNISTCPVSDVQTVEGASIPPSTLNIPIITTDLLDVDAPPSPSICQLGGRLPLTTSRPMASLAVPHLSLSLDTASSDGDSSFCSTPGNSTPEVLSPGIFTPEGCQSPLFIPSGMMFLSDCLSVGHIACCHLSCVCVVVSVK